MANDIKIIFEAETAPIDRAVRLLDNLEAELRDVQRAEKQGLISKQRLNNETKRLNSSISRLKSLSHGSAKDFRKFEKSLYGSGKAARANEVAMQQAGYQVQDFIVQIQSGTNPLIAFSQQGSQLAGFFAGPWGASIGLGIAALGFLGTALMGLGEKAKTFEKQIEGVTSSVDELVKLREKLSGGFEEAFSIEKEKVEQFSQVTKDLLAIAKIKAFNNVKDLAQNLADANTEAAWYSLKGDKAITAPLLNMDVQLKGNITTWKKAKEEVQNFITSVRGISEQSNIREMYESAVKARDIFKSHVDVTKQLTEEQRNFWEQISLTIQQLELLGAAQKTYSTGYEGEFDGTMEHMGMSGPTPEEMQRGYAAVQRAQASIAQTEKQRMDEAEQHHDRMIALQNAAARAAKEAAEEQKADQDQIYHNSLLAIQNAMAQEHTKAKLQKELADQTHAHMIALQNAYYADAKRQAGEVASATYLANYNAVMAYQAYGQSRMAAPTEPVKPPKIGGGAKKETASEYLKKLMDEAKYKRSIIGLSEEEERVQEILYEAKKKELVLTKEQAQAVAKIEEETRRLQQTQELYDSIQSHIENGFMSLIDGSKSVADAFKSMLRNILLEIYKQQIAKPLAEGIMSVFSANGNVFNAGGGLTAFANGGVVNSPTLFGYSGGTGLMGEAGPEAIMPLKRGADGKLGVAGGGGVVVHQTFNFAANGDDSVKKIIAQAAPQIAEMTKRSVIADRRRGGQMKAAFN